MFNKNIYILGFFIDLSKAFDTVNHKILLKKNSHYGIKVKSLKSFNCYLSNRKQFIGYNVNSKITLLDIVCRVPQGSIFGHLLFLLYVNDLPQASKSLDSTMFADDANLFYSGKGIHSLCNALKSKFSNISQWFNSNKLSLNADKIKFTLFHKVRQRDHIPLVLPTLKISNTLMKRVDHIQFLFDENLAWENHINLIENKISKSLGILHRAKFLLNQKSRKNVYFSFIHSYINYGNIAWGNKSKTKFKKVFTYQKNAARGPTHWNTVLGATRKEIESLPLFKAKKTQKNASLT